MTVTGPYTREVTSHVSPPGYTWHWEQRRKYQEWYRQQPRTSKPLPYVMRDYWDNGTTGNSWAFPPDETARPDVRDYAHKRAYDKLKGELSESSSLGATIGERKEAIGMMTNRVVQLWKFAKALRRGNIGEAARVLNVAVPPGRSPRMNPRRAAKSLGGLWLEFWLGWSPMVSDIYNAVNILQSGLPPFKITGRGSDAWGTQVTEQNFWDNRGQIVRCQIKATVTVTDPNLWRANQLGLINPASVVWELVPLSFIGDWFLPIGDFLSQFTDFAGISLTDASTTYYTISYHRTFYTDGRPLAFQERMGASVTRTLGFHQPVLAVNRLTGLSVTRAATAISLLLQQLRH